MFAWDTPPSCALHCPSASTAGAAPAFPGSASHGMWEALLCRLLTSDSPTPPPLWDLAVSLARDEYAGLCAAFRPFAATKIDVATDAARAQVGAVACFVRGFPPPLLLRPPLFYISICEHVYVCVSLSLCVCVCMCVWVLWVRSVQRAFSPSSPHIVL